MNKDIYVLFGYPLQNSLSPKIHNSSLQKSLYFNQPVKPENLSFAIEAIKKFSWKGANITIPHKVNVIKYLNELSDNAKIIGAVNTISNLNGYLVGHNTDVIGFLKTLPKELSRDKAVIIGAGGAARAVILSLIQFGYKRIDIINRTFNKAKFLKNYYEELFNDIQLNAYELSLIDTKLEGNILINCTPLDNPIPDDSIKYLVNFECVYDLKYLSNSNLLLRAKQLNVKHTINGLEMLILQAAYSQKIWTGNLPNLELIREALK